MNKRADRITAVLLSLMLVATMVFSSAAVYAEDGDNGASKAGVTAAGIAGKTLNEIISGSGDEEDGNDPLEDTVIVMMEDDSLTTEKKVKKVLTTGEEPVKDITVEEVWTFDEETSGMKLNGESDEDPGDDTVVALVSSDSMSAGRLAKKLSSRDDVVAAEKNVRVHMQSVSNDAYSDFQWAMQPNDNSADVGYEWTTKGVTGSDKIVAVVDTGVDYTHPDLKDNMWVNTHKGLKGEHGFDFINGKPDPMDDNGHGTHCAGIIGAVGDNGIGISGVNKKIRIMGLKTLDFEGSAWLSHEVAAYNYINKALDLGEPVVAINNSWAGGDESEIFRKLIDIVGAKGAATVCAAGNEGSNNDIEPVYPSDTNSPYLIDVAATDRTGNLADYSNYGESVDIAAPGSEILSTVPYEVYNPEIYGDQQDSISAEYNSYDDDSNTFGVPEMIYVNGEECEKDGDVYTGKDGREIKVEMVDEGFADGDNRSMKISYKGLKSDDLVSFLLPYEVQEGAKIKPTLGFMCKTKGPKNATDFFSSSLALIADLAEDEKPDMDCLGEKTMAGLYVSGESTEWGQLNFNGDESSNAGDRRKFCVTLFSAVDGDFEILFDDIGLSRQDIEREAFGKYEYMSGTSMAAPFISGVVALMATEKEKDLAEGQTLDIADVLNEISAMAKDEPELDVGSKGAFDFRKTVTVLPPRIGSVTVDTESDTIRISGSGLYADQLGFKVEVGEDDDHMKEAEIIPSDDAGKGSEVLIRNDGWINNVENIRVTGTGGKTSRKKGIYLVKGKNEYTKNDNVWFDMSTEAMCTDGRYIYGTWSLTGEISAYDTKSGDSRMIAEADASKLFHVNKEDLDENAQYGMLFGEGLVYSNGVLYNVAEFGEADIIEAGGDIWFDSNNGKAGNGASKTQDNKDDGNVTTTFDGPFSIYSGEYRLISIGTKKEADNDVKDLGKLPEELEEMYDYTMASYNGKIYFIGGYTLSGDSKQYSDKVFIYDPAKKTWSEGASLPSGRSGGKALQSGSVLVYTMGEADGVAAGEFPDNLVFDGKEWKVCVSKNSAVKMYESDQVSIGLTAGGIIYSGAPMFDLGDTFIFDINGSEYVDTGYNYLDDPDNYGVQGVVAGNTLYGASDGVMYTIPVKSGLAKVSASKKGKGKVSGTGSFMPGNDAKITVKASKKYYIKSLKVGGKTIKVKKNATKKTYTIKALTANKKVSVVFAKKKAKK
ncbi:MAG: S8 family serine peptidase [Eubacterium sp.]|nr:S8 family serine peptidase [Eubacterium sp.]